MAIGSDRKRTAAIDLAMEERVFWRAEKPPVRHYKERLAKKERKRALRADMV